MLPVEFLDADVSRRSTIQHESTFEAALYSGESNLLSFSPLRIASAMSWGSCAIHRFMPAMPDG
jgi:hypothetical protein